MDRPHILYVSETGKYVCWLKYSGKTEACFCILTADHILGPYQMEKENFRPFGKEVGDFDIWQDEDGTAYLYFASGHDGVVACALTLECTDVVQPHKVYYEDLPVPYCREGIAMVKHDGTLYMLTSGMTGYIANPTEAPRLDGPLGNLEVLGNPHLEDPSGASFHSQISMIFPHPKKEGSLFLSFREKVGFPLLALYQPDNVLPVLENGQQAHEAGTGDHQNVMGIEEGEADAEGSSSQNTAQ